MIPRRLLWLTLIVETVTLGLIGLIALLWLDAFDNGYFIAVALLVIGLSDVLTAVYLERRAPTAVTLGPNESEDELVVVARYFESVGSELEGQVRVRGEIWRATAPPGAGRGLLPGRKVKVVRRDGLTLEVAPLEDDS